MTGSFFRTVDKKSRLVIPPELRRDGQTEMVLARGRDGWLLLLPEDAYREREAQMHADPVLRFWWQGGAYPVTMRDVALPGEAYRLGIPQPLREWAGLRAGSEVALVGQGDWILIGTAERAREMLARAGRLLGL